MRIGSDTGTYQRSAIELPHRRMPLEAGAYIFRSISVWRERAYDRRWLTTVEAVMKFGAALLGLSLLAASAHSALADASFTFSNVTFSSTPGGAANAGTLTGTFTTNDALSTILSYDITASPVGSFLGFHYTTSNSFVSASSLPTQYFRIDSNNGLNQLQIVFASTLSRTNSTVILSPQSSEHEASGGNRYPTGSIAAVATPGPVAGAGLVALLGMIGAFFGRRRFNGATSV